MRVLIDTHVLLWWLADDAALSELHRDTVANPDHDVLVSAITMAEISLKSSLGKLVLPDGFDDAVLNAGFEELPFTAAHSIALRQLPWHHRDPFDRMLLAQARTEGLVFATADARCTHYGVQVL